MLLLVPDAVFGLTFLRRQPPYGHAPRPQVVVLDGSTVRMSALDVLKAVRQDAALMDLPVLVFSASAAPSDVQLYLTAGATDFITVPIRLDEYTEVVRRTLAFWAATTGSGQP